MPANGTLCSGRMCLQTRCSAKESGHSLEFNGPLQTREHSLPVIRRKKGALDRLYSKQEFHSLLLYDNMYAHVLYWEGLVMQSGILPRRFYKNKPHLICTVLLLRPELCLCLFLVCVSCLCVISLATFFLGMVLIHVSCTMSWTSVHSSSGTLSIRPSPLNLFLTSTV